MMTMQFAAMIVAFAVILHPFIWRRLMITQSTQDSIAKFAQAETNFKAQVTAGIAAGVAPVQNQLDLTTAALKAATVATAEVTTNLNDNEVAVAAAADAALAASTVSAA